MPIKELEKDLQRKDSPLTHRKHDKTVYDVWKSKESDEVESSVWQKIKDKMLSTRLRAITIGGIIVFGIIFIALVTASFVYFQGGFFANERVTLSIDVPTNIGSNTLTEIVFTYNNRNRASLNNVQIAVQFGDYFIPVEDQENFKRVSDSQGIITIGTINGNDKDSIVLAGHFVGPAGSVDDVSGTLRYVPERTSTRYETAARGATAITSSPISIDVKAPFEIVSGNLIDVAIGVKNTSNEAVSNLKLIIEAPENFSMYDSTPNTMNGKTWFISTIAPRSEQIIHVRGGLNAAIGTAQVFDMEVGTQESGGEYVVYANGKYTPRIIGSPIIVRQNIEEMKGDAVYAGDRLKYIIRFINNGDVPLGEAIVSVKFDTRVLDFSQLDLENKGDYDEESKTITWKASDISKLQLLKPGESGEISFMIPVLAKLPVNSEDDYNFSVTTLVSIDSDDIPSELRENKTVLSNVLTKAVGAKVILGSSIEYMSGVRPPKVGEKTAYTATLTVDNINNDISDSVVTVPLPTHTKFVRGDDVEFNERTNEVVWTIGDIAHGAGVIRDTVQTSFDIEIVPSVDQIDKSPLILQKQSLVARDLFADVDIEEIGKSITTSDIQNKQDENVDEGAVQS